MIAAASLTAVERVRQAYAHLAGVDRPEVWITLRTEAESLDAAAVVDARVAAGEVLPLVGTTVAVKDNIDVAGLPTTAGHPAYAYLPGEDAVAVSRLLEAGAVVIGKTNLDQFATGLVGTRSPYGAVRDSRRADRISGGSSSGSAVAVALGIADVALGTDTAGSGRVPASLQGIVGIKPTRGLISVRGVVPAIRGLDCVSVFARDLDTALLAAHVLAAPDDLDPAARAWPADAPLAEPAVLRVGVPRSDDLAALSEPYHQAYLRAIDQIGADPSVRVTRVELAPFLAASSLLYDGSFIAGRHATVGAFLDDHSEGTDATVAGLIQAAAGLTASDLVVDQERLADLTLEVRRTFDDIDVLLLPTTTRHPLISEVDAEPVAINAELGIFTNFCNLLDLCAVAVPFGDAAGGPFGVSLVAPAFADRVASDAAARFTAADPSAPGLSPAGVPFAVFGAHLSGQPLNGQLVGARLVGAIQTAPRYRLFALPTEPPKPGLLRVDEGGASISGELWLAPPTTVAAILAALPPPMMLGPVQLDDGSQVVGFGCESVALANAREITAYGSWMAYLSDPSGEVTPNVVDHDGTELLGALEVDGVASTTD